MPKMIEATYRAVTPLFNAGADLTKQQVRSPSFKGVLRFWWRALAWSRCAGNLDEIRCQEAQLFGSADGGQSRILLRITPSGQRPTFYNKDEVLTYSTIGGVKVVGQGARYLGYGVMSAFANKKANIQAGQLTRSCLGGRFDFTVRLLCRNLSDVDLTLLEEALITLGTLGGMGAKSRKGYGSLALQSLVLDGKRCWSTPKSMGELQNTIASLRCGQETKDLPEYTALSSGTRHILLSSDAGEPLELLDSVGREIIRYRSWGKGGKILGGKTDSEKNFEDDHDLMKGIKTANALPYPRRVAFGLPHNYGKKAHQMVKPKDFDRRASPLFIHIHECDSKPIAVLSFLPGRFLPPGSSRLSVGGKEVKVKPEEELYRPIHAFLDRLLDKGKCQESFSKAVEV